DFHVTGVQTCALPIYAKIPPDRRVRIQEHVVKKGETLSGIAARYGVTVAALRRANRLEGKDDRRLPVGKRLRIPRAGGEVLLARSEERRVGEGVWGRG